MDEVDRSCIDFVLLETETAMQLAIPAILNVQEVSDLPAESAPELPGSRLQHRIPFGLGAPNQTLFTTWFKPRDFTFRLMKGVYTLTPAISRSSFWLVRELESAFRNGSSDRDV